MNSLSFKSIKRCSTLALILAFTSVFPAYAQNTNNRNDNVRTEDRTDRTPTPRVITTQEDDTDWGWLGLLGLLGLAGLLPKKRSIEVKGVRDQNETRPTSTTGTTH